MQEDRYITVPYTGGIQNNITDGLLVSSCTEVPTKNIANTLVRGWGVAWKVQQKRDWKLDSYG